jgi:4-alpha-glucanotransferase
MTPAQAGTARPLLQREGSFADMAIIPMQDVLGLDSSARMNTPSVIKDKFNYVWKLKASQLKPDTAKMLAENAAIYGR